MEQDLASTFRTADRERRDGAAPRQSLVAVRAGPLRCHAYLLTGPAQVGKRTLARAMASALVCTAPDGGVVPCGGCAPAGWWSAGAPGRARRGAGGRAQGVTIEQVRLAHPRRRVAAHESTHKAFLLTAVEAMSDAANALLKTLEEPPADTVLLLTSNDASQVLPTIASRCREVALRPVPVHQIEEALGGRGVEPETARAPGPPPRRKAGLGPDAAGDPSAWPGTPGRSTCSSPSSAGPAGSASPRLPPSAGGRSIDTLDVWLGWWRRHALLVQQDCLTW